MPAVLEGPKTLVNRAVHAAGNDPGGALVILNYSYRGDLERDRTDVANLAARHGFIAERNGTRDFALWDAATFLLRRSG